MFAASTYYGLGAAWLNCTSAFPEFVAFELQNVNKATELLSKMNKSSMKSRVGATYTGTSILSHSITICIFAIILRNSFCDCISALNIKLDVQCLNGC